MKKFIKIEKLRFKMIYPLGMAISHLINTLIIDYALFYKNEEKEKAAFFRTWIMFIGETLVGLLFLVINLFLKKTDKKNKSEEDDKKIHVDSVEYISGINAKKKVLKDWTINVLILLILGALDFFGSFCLNIIRIDNKYLELLVKVFYVMLQVVMCIYFLNFQYYRHHYIGILILFIGVIFAEIGYYFDKNGKWKLSIPPVICGLLFVIFDSIQETSEKYIMDSRFVDPLVILVIEGFFSVITIPLILFLFSKFCGENEEDIKLLLCDNAQYILKGKIKLEGAKKILWLIPLVFVYGLFNYFRVQTNFFFTPTHRTISDNFSLLIQWIISRSRISEKHYIHLIYEIPGYLMIVFGTLLFHEIISVAIFKMNKNTAKEYEKRGNAEINDVMSHQSLLQENQSEALDESNESVELAS